MTSAGGLLQCGPEGGGTQSFIGGRDLDLAGISGTLQQAVEVGFPQSIPVRRQTPEDDETVSVSIMPENCPGSRAAAAS